MTSRTPSHGLFAGYDYNGDEYERDLEQGFEWAPKAADPEPYLDGYADGLVPETALPAWMRERTS